MEKVFLKLLSWIPKNYRAITGFILIIILLIGFGIHFEILPNWFKSKKEIAQKCEFVSISGKLIDQNNKEIYALEVNIEGMNLNKDNTVQGVFTLKGVRIPADSLISFQVKLADTIYFVKGFDLGNTLKYPMYNCKIDVGVIRLNIKKTLFGICNSKHA